MVLGIKIKDLVNIIEVANQQYFDEGESFLSDNTFDILVDILKQSSPNNPLLKKLELMFMKVLKSITSISNEKSRKSKTSY